MAPGTTTLHPGIPTTDIFTVPYMDGYILYIPRAGVVAGVDRRIHEVVQAVVRGEPVAESDANREFLTALERLGAFAPKPETAEIALDPFRPTDVTLSLTSRCHLRCVYCYARAGEAISDMDEEIIESALTMVAENAVQTQKPKITVSFHGEGEPTANWQLFQLAVNRAKQLGQERQLEVEFTMSTNGMWSPTQREFVADHFNRLSMSMDGLPEVQNAQRPTAAGGPSFPTIFENLKYLEARGIDYGFRATVLPEFVSSMVPFMEYAHANFKCDSVHYEPVFLTGRATRRGMSDLDVRELYRSYVAEFHRAQARGREMGIEVGYSGCRGSRYSAQFCGATGPEPNFFISTRGIVSSCYELIDPESAKGRFTVYGRYDRERHQFLLDPEKLLRIRTFGVHKLAHCDDCFARWTCSGDCFARSDFHMSDSGDVLGSRESPRCDANRETTLRDLISHGLVGHVRAASEPATV